MSATGTATIADTTMTTMTMAMMDDDDNDDGEVDDGDDNSTHHLKMVEVRLLFLLKLCNLFFSLVPVNHEFLIWSKTMRLT